METTNDLLTGNFKFVLIPYDETKQIQQLEESKSGGLTNDKLIQYARNYFGPTEICDIAAITIPLPTNNYTAVSLYHVGGSDGKNNNKRAMELIVGCGMNMSITGDVFIGRCIDNEIGDIWERIDFTIEDCDPSSTWCEVARQNASNKSKSTTPSSLSGILQQQFNPGTTSVIQQGPPAATDSTFGQNGNYVKEEWGIWTQTDDEIELKFIVSDNIQVKKDIQIKFNRTKLSVCVANQILLSGSTFDPIDVDECTYTIQTENQSRELCITLIKQNIGVTWPYTAK